MKSDKSYLRILQSGCVISRPIEIEEVFTMFLRCCRQPFAFAGEFHEPWEMVYIRKGEALITADDKIYHLSAGNVIFHRPMEFHQIYGENPGLEIFVASFHMSGKHTGKFKNAEFTLQPEEIALFEQLIDSCMILNGGQCIDAEERDYTPLWKESPLPFYNCVHQLENIMCRLLLRSPAVPAVPETADSLLYQKAVSVLEAHVHSKVTIQKVAQLCGVSASSLKLCFNRHAGCGLHKYFLKMKIRAAIRMIRGGQAIGSVSDDLGFNNPNYFSYVFQRETGKRPTDYRK